MGRIIVHLAFLCFLAQSIFSAPFDDEDSTSLSGSVESIALDALPPPTVMPMIIPSTAIALCPVDYPFAYLDGSYCCKTKEERPVEWGITPQNEIDDGTCDGVDFNIQSVCCKAEAYTPCPDGSGCFGSSVEECPLFCPFNYDPVCGDNGETYANECQFNVAKCNGEVNEIAFEGDCETSIEILPSDPIVNCYIICSEIYEPVCGSNGETYGNECLLDAAKCLESDEIEFVHDGACDENSNPVTQSNNITAVMITELPTLIGLAAPSYLSIEGYEDCLDIDSSSIGVSMLCLPKEKPVDCLEDSWLKINVEFDGNVCPEGSYIEAVDNLVDTFLDNLFGWLEPTSDDEYDYGYDYESCEEVIKEDILSAADCADLCFYDRDCADWHFDEMQCVHELCEYDYYYGYDNEYAPIESCEEVVPEDILSAADCADLCHDDWDCANWDFVEDEMKCVHKQFCDEPITECGFFPWWDEEELECITVHCSFTVDNELDYVMYNNQLLNVSGGDTGDWQQEKEISFQSCDGSGNPGTLEIQGTNWEQSDHCVWAGLLLHCTVDSNHDSPWHNFVSGTKHWKAKETYYSAEKNDPLCQNDELFPRVGKGIPFIDSLNANGAKKIWTEEKTATLIGSPPPSNDPPPMPEECPAFCPLNYDPVCGDNGETYSNECQFDVAKCNGEVKEIAFEGDCDKNIEIQTTTPNVLCDLFCLKVYEPVCGDNGKTYSNECQFEIAKCNGEVNEITFVGKCDPEIEIPPTTPNVTCDLFCSNIYEPVCGDDGETYSNECYFEIAKCNGEVNEITFVGKCDPEIEILPTTPNVACDLFCFEIYEPVCGDNGETYSNECQFEVARCNGEVKEIASEGACDKEEPEMTLLKEGLKCDYEPTYCKNHGAIAYAIFPTNDDGKCNKKPILDKEFCEQGFNGTNPAVMTTYEPVCSYCVLGSIEEPKYFAAIADVGMECKVTCDENKGPQCTCFTKY